jgi:hypothetical protein
MISAARLKELLGGMNTAAKKVYDDVPINETWSATNICAVSNKSRNVSYEVVRGCLDALVRAGLIRQTKDGFQREPVRPAVKKVENLAGLRVAIEETKPQEKEVPMHTPANKALAAPKPCVVDNISALAQQLAAMSLRHAQEVKDLAALFSDAAIDVQGALEENSEAVGKLKQLQAIFKGI